MARWAERRFNREVHLVTYSAQELEEKVRAGHHFVLQVLKGEKTFLVGDEGELRSLLHSGDAV